MSQIVQDPKIGEVMAFQKGESVKIKAILTNVGDSDFTYSSWSYGFTVYDLKGVDVWSIGADHLNI